MKSLFIKDTYVSGKPVYKGQVRDLPESEFRLLGGMRRVVELAKATKEQAALVEARQKIDEANSEKLSATEAAN
jgi:hypothetical protein